MKIRVWFALMVSLAVLSFSPSLFAIDLTGSLLKTAGQKAITLLEEMSKSSSVTVPAKGSLEVAFSPNGGAEHLVIKVIETATQDIQVLAYSFTNPQVVQALINAHKRGVKVSVVVDEEFNVRRDKTGRSHAALSALSHAGVDVRVLGAYPIAHDKVLIADGLNVQTGSFNYSTDAEKRNSENVLVSWRNPELAKVYLEHFKRNQSQSVPYVGR